MRPRAIALLALLAALAEAGEDQAARLEARAIERGRAAEEHWKRFVLERPAFPDQDLRALVETYEEVVDLFHQSLEIEERPAINNQIVVVARRLAKLRFEQMRRSAARRPQPEAAPVPAPEPEPQPAAGPEAREPPGPEPDGEAAHSPWPELEETKAERGRGLQSLRDFLMNYYFANRKFSSLIARCTGCNGHRKVPAGREPRTRRIIFKDCPQCGGTGAFLEVAPARKAFWLVKSPLFRARPENQAAFEARLARWKEHPAEVGEFLKGLSIGEIEYHGLWAVVKFKERGYAVATSRRFGRDVKAVLIRTGKRWFFYDETSDQDFFAQDAE